MFTGYPSENRGRNREKAKAGELLIHGIPDMSLEKITKHKTKWNLEIELNWTMIFDDKTYDCLEFRDRTELEHDITYDTKKPKIIHN